MKIVRSILFLLTVCAGMSAAPRPGRILQEACGEAQNVVLGAVENTVTSTHPARFTLRVDEVVSGPMVAKTLTYASWPGSMVGAKAVSIGYRALWFLRRASSADWEIMPIGGSKAPVFASALAVPQVARREAGGAGCYESVLAILAANEEYVDRSPQCFTAMETLLREDPPSASAAGPIFSKMLGTFTQSSSMTVQALALGAGVRRGDIRFLKQVANQSVVISQSKAGQHLNFAVAEWRNSDPEALMALGDLANEGSGNSLNRSAAEALMMIHTKDAVPHLVRLLSSRDAVLRGAGIRGLSMFVLGVPIMTPGNVRSMQYLSEKPGDYWDPGIAPYISITPLPMDKEAAFVNAWTAWAIRHAERLSK